MSNNHRRSGGTRLILTMLMMSLAGRAGATPSTEYWTPCISDVQAFNTWHLGIDNYFTVDKKAASGDQGAFPTDIGITVGILPFDKVQLEVGIDALYPSDNPYYFNAKLGAPEGSIFNGAPALNIGIFNVGTKRGVTDYDIVDFVVGKTLPWSLGRLHAGYYIGNGDVLVSSSGEREEDGFMVAYDCWLLKDKVLLAADYASGDNAIGGGGVGIYYYFTKDISVLVGPVWFNDKGINGDTKWTTQLDANF
jgi:hypothetical protein